MTSPTLATLRERVRVMVETAQGTPAPLPVTASSATLSTIRDRVEETLQDSLNAIWDTDDLDEAIRKALEMYSRYTPYHALTTITATIDSREIDISNIAGLMRVEKVWWAYDPTTPGYPPNYVQFSVLPGGLLYIEDATGPVAGDQIRIWYTTNQTISDLDGGAATTIPSEDIGYIVIGAAGYAAQQRQLELTEQAAVDADVVNRLKDYAETQLKAFRLGAQLDQPAWQRYGAPYSQDDIDEGLRWALHRYNEVNSQEAITTLTFAADGYEVATTSITNMLKITKVWCPYTAADPEDPPEWRTFEVWPGILRLTDAEVDAGEIARVWYTKPHTLSGLDDAVATTFQDDHATILVTGTAGIVVAMRTHEQVQSGMQTKLQVWSEARLKEFERMLTQLRRKPTGGYINILPRRRGRVPRA